MLREILPLFLMPTFIALLQHWQGNRWRRLHLAGLLVGIGLLVASFSNGRHYDAMVQLMVWGLPSALIVNGVGRLDYTPKNWFGRMAVILGDASYSIYLIQVFSIPVMAFILSRTGLIRSLPVDASVLLFVTWTAAAGWMTWRLVERPITRRLRKGLDRYTPEPVATAV